MFTKDTEVTAVSTFKGRPEERELSFDYGDLIKIISLVPKVGLCLDSIVSFDIV